MTVASPAPRSIADRIVTVLQHSFASLLPPVFNAAISMLVVRVGSPQLWGGVVDVIVIAQLCAHVIAWGNKEHLLREFSQGDSGVKSGTDSDDGTNSAQSGAQSGSIGGLWLTSLVTRGTLLAPLCLAAALSYGWLGQGWGVDRLLPCAVWIVAQVLLQSLDVAVLFHKRFTRQIVVELLATGLMIAALWTQLPGADVATLLWLLAAATAAKALFLRFWLRADLRASASVSVEPALIRQALPFFLLGVTGLLGSRIDLYCVAAQLPDAEVARYQIVMNMLLYLQALSNLILLPFVREVYGMELVSIRSLAVRFTGLGAALALPGLALVWLAMRIGYQLPISLAFVGLGYVYVVQMFAALPLIYGLYKSGSEAVVLRMNVAMVVLNFAGNLALIPVWGLEGALLSSAAVQTGGAVAYWLVVSRKVEKVALL